MLNRLQDIDPTQINQVQPEPVTWAGHVLIPLTQNLLGGVAVGALGYLSTMAVSNYYGWHIDADGVQLWCEIAGGLVASVVTITRFFGDDLGIIRAAYVAGQRSRDAQVSSLELEIRALRDANHAAQASGNAASATKREGEFYIRAHNDAKTLIRVHFNRDSIRRAAMVQRGMGQRDWERAAGLLKAAGVMDGDYNITARTVTQAFKAIDERIKADSGRGDNFTPAWK